MKKDNRSKEQDKIEFNFISSTTKTNSRSQTFLMLIVSNNPIVKTEVTLLFFEIFNSINQIKFSNRKI